MNKPIYFICELSDENKKKVFRRASRMLSKYWNESFELSKKEVLEAMMNEKILTLYGTETTAECIKMNDFFDIRTMTEKA